jgi:hypothetical protein
MLNRPYVKAAIEAQHGNRRFSGNIGVRAFAGCV